MMQPSQLGFGPSTNPPQWFGNGSFPGAGTGQTATGTSPSDGVTRPWWANGTNANGVCPDGYGNGASSNNSWQFGNTMSGLGGVGNGIGGGSLAGLLSGLVGALQQLLGSLTGATGGTGTGSLTGGTGSQTPWSPWSPPNQSFPTNPFAPPNHFSPQQQVGDMTISSTADPHIAETGTVVGWNGTTTQVDKKYDSMTSHGDLVDSASVAGGYKVSTTVTAPNANGATYNQSATVSANGGQDAVTLNRDGSFSVTDGGKQVQLTKGQTLTLSGGETVTEDANGYLTVAANNGQGGTVSTQLRSNGQYVDVSTTAHDIGLGGDVMRHNPPPKQTD